MCKSAAEGGQRCPKFTRTRLAKKVAAVEAAVAGLGQAAAGDGDGDLAAARAALVAARAEWEQAAAEYASTDEGHRHLSAQAEAAEAAGDLDTAALLRTVVTREEAIRAANQEAGALIRAVRLSQAAVTPASTDATISTTGADATPQETTLAGAPVVPDLAPADRRAWNAQIEGLRAMVGDVDNFRGMDPSKALEAFEEVDATLGDPTATEDDLVGALARYEIALGTTSIGAPTVRMDPHPEWDGSPEASEARQRVRDGNNLRDERVRGQWRDWARSTWGLHKAQAARALDHPNAGERTYRRVLAEHTGLTRKATGDPRCPLPVLNQAMRGGYATGSGDSDLSVHPDGWARARDARMGNPSLALTLACTDPDTWQRHEALNQVMMTPLEDLSREDREYLVTNLHKIPGEENQKTLAASVVGFAQGLVAAAEFSRRG